LLGFTASFGYSASLPLQERLIEHTPGDVRGQVMHHRDAGPHPGPAPVHRPPARTAGERPGDEPDRQQLTSHSGATRVHGFHVTLDIQLRALG
jgi:hypothetical protein